MAAGATYGYGGGGTVVMTLEDGPVANDDDDENDDDDDDDTGGHTGQEVIATDATVDVDAGYRCGVLRGEDVNGTAVAAAGGGATWLTGATDGVTTDAATPVCAGVVLVAVVVVEEEDAPVGCTGVDDGTVDKEDMPSLDARTYRNSGGTPAVVNRGSNSNTLLIFAPAKFSARR